MDRLGHGAAWLGPARPAPPPRRWFWGTRGFLPRHWPGRAFEVTTSPGSCDVISTYRSLRLCIWSESLFAARWQGQPPALHLKTHTGLHRNDACCSIRHVCCPAQASSNGASRLGVRGIWSDDPGRPAAQIRAFEESLGRASDPGLRPELVHLRKYGPVPAVAHAHIDMVRAGLALYGVESDRSRMLGLRPAMVLRELGLPSFGTPAQATYSIGVSRTGRSAKRPSRIQVRHSKVQVDEGVQGREVDVAVQESPNRVWWPNHCRRSTCAAGGPWFDVPVELGGSGYAVRMSARTH
ncbi:alanine racemase [Streptomyces vinaceus]|uniref:alanine racemase n=1 Tax=Streptomyces vinaceus TaxID=1960 RepID=UPI00381EF063